jgi:hypothetical protein
MTHSRALTRFSLAPQYPALPEFRAEIAKRESERINDLPEIRVPTRRPNILTKGLSSAVSRRRRALPRCLGRRRVDAVFPIAPPSGKMLVTLWCLSERPLWVETCRTLSTFRRLRRTSLKGGIAVTSKRRTYTTHYWASDSNSAFASAICRNSGVGEKPSSAGLRTSQASAGRPVD